MTNKACAIVDAYSSSNLYAPAFKARGEGQYLKGIPTNLVCNSQPPQRSRKRQSHPRGLITADTASPHRHWFLVRLALTVQPKKVT